MVIPFLYHLAFSFLETTLLVHSKVVFKDDCPINSTNRVCSQSLLSSAQVSFLNQHPPVLQAKEIISELQQLKNEHIHCFHSLLFLQTDGEREQSPNIPPLPTRNSQSLSETKVPSEKFVTSQWRWAEWDCPLPEASIAPGVLKGAHLWQFMEQTQSNCSRATANFQDHRMRNRNWETEGWILTFLKFFLHN